MVERLYIDRLGNRRDLLGRKQGIWKVICNGKFGDRETIIYHYVDDLREGVGSSFDYMSGSVLWKVLFVDNLMEGEEIECECG